jgi:hypothetical protein
LSLIAERILPAPAARDDAGNVGTITVHIDSDMLRKPAIDDGDSYACTGRTRWQDGAG